MLCHLLLELGVRSKRCQGVIVGFGQKLHAAGGGKGLERVNHLRSEPLELVQGAAGDGVSDLELPLVCTYELQHELVHGKIALLGHTAQDCAVGKVVVVMGIFADIKESVQAEPGGLMDLEIQADALCCHNILFYN